MDSFNAIPIFVAVAKHGGFSAAARELGLSKSAISKRITQLEDQLAARLIHRTTRKLSLTEAGERFYQHALSATIAAQNAEDSVSELLGDPQGILKVHAPMSFGLLHLAPLIPVFLKHYPNINIELMMDDQAIDIVAQGFDISIRPGELPDSTLIARKLASLRSMVCMSPEYLTKTALTSPANLEEENCLLYSYSSNAAYWDFSLSGKKERVNVKGNYRVNSSEALKEAILQGAGIGRLPSFVAGEYIRTGKLIQIFCDYDMAEKNIYAVYPVRNYVPAKVRCFLDFCVEYYGEKVPYWDKGLFND
jgi:DNA-binding transcriptional LysR family regulator